MTAFDCPICGRSQSAELVTPGGEANCRACHAEFVVDDATLAALGQAKKLPVGLDPDFDAMISKVSVRSTGASLLVAIACLSLVFLLLVLGAGWVSVRQEEATVAPSAVKETPIPVEDAQPTAAVAPIVDPSSFRRPDLDRR